MIFSNKYVYFISILMIAISIGWYSGFYEEMIRYDYLGYI